MAKKRPITDQPIVTRGEAAEAKKAADKLSEAEPESAVVDESNAALQQAAAARIEGPASDSGALDDLALGEFASGDALVGTAAEQVAAGQEQLPDPEDGEGLEGDLTDAAAAAKEDRHDWWFGGGDAEPPPSPLEQHGGGSGAGVNAEGGTGWTGGQNVYGQEIDPGAAPPLNPLAGTAETSPLTAAADAADALLGRRKGLSAGDDTEDAPASGAVASGMVSTGGALSSGQHATTTPDGEVSASVKKASSDNPLTKFGGDVVNHTMGRTLREADAASRDDYGVSSSTNTAPKTDPGTVTTRTTTPSGGTKTTYQDGSSMFIGKDGTTIENNGHGTTTTVSPDGSRTTATHHDDGTHTSTTTWKNQDGSTTTQTTDNDGNTTKKTRMPLEDEDTGRIAQDLQPQLDAESARLRALQTQGPDSGDGVTDPAETDDAAFGAGAGTGEPTGILAQGKDGLIGNPGTPEAGISSSAPTGNPGADSQGAGVIMPGDDQAMTTGTTRNDSPFDAAEPTIEPAADSDDGDTESDAGFTPLFNATLHDDGVPDDLEFVDELDD